jgi:hypothetical protein
VFTPLTLPDANHVPHAGLSLTPAR